MDDDKIYLNYGDAQVEQQAFLKAAADSVESYLSEQPWSNKRKQLFRNAYSDLMTRGILGASNSTGSWKVQYGGDPVDLDSKSEKEKEMYGEAAYFIQQQMSGLASAKPQEQQKKSNVPVFSNDEFNSQFEQWIGRNMFGSQKDWAKQWVELDNNNNGIYETSEREKALAEQLRSFGEHVSKNPDKFNFEGSAYDNLDDFLNRINNAATSLETKGYDRNDINALNQLGLNPSNYFYTGADRIVTLDDGTQMTLQEYNERQANKLKQQAQHNRDILAKHPFYFGNRSIYAPKKGTPYSVMTKESLYNLGQDKLLQELRKINGQNLLNSQQLSLLRGAFTHLPSQPIDDDTYAALKTSSSLHNRSKNDFIKINGVDHIIYDKKTGSFIVSKLDDSKPATTLEDFFASPQVSDDEKISQARKNMKETISSLQDLNPSQKLELEALMWDILSFADPELLSGSGLALYAAKLRDEANPDRSMFNKILDYGTGALSGVQFIGDGLQLIKAGNVFSRLVNGSVKTAGAIGTALGTITGVPALGRVLIKLVKDPTSITAKDIEDLGYGALALIGLKRTAGAVGRQRAQRTARQATKPQEYITVTDRNGDHKVAVDPETAAIANKNYRGFQGKGKASKKVLENEKVKEAVEAYNGNHQDKPIDLNTATIEGKSFLGIKRSATTLEHVPDPNANFSPVSATWFPSTTRITPWTRNLYSRQSKESSSSKLWSRVKEWYSGDPYVKPNTEINKPNTETNKPNIESPKSESASTNSTLSSTREHISPQDFGLPKGTNLKSYVQNALGKNKKYNNKSAKRLIRENQNYQESFNFGNGQSVDIKIQNGKLTVTDSNGNIIGRTQELDKTNYSFDVKRKISKILDDYRRTLNNSRLIQRQYSKEFIESIKKFKSEGLIYKQGGTIDKQKIQKYKEFIKK